MSSLGPTATRPPVADESVGGDQTGSNEKVVLSAIALALLLAVPAVPDKLQLGTVVCIGLFPFLVKTVFRTLRARLLVATTVLWAIGQVIADHVNGLSLGLSLPFMLAVTILATTTSLLYFSGGQFRGLRLLTMGVASGLVLSEVVLRPASIVSAESWKFGLDLPVAIALLAFTDLAWRRGKRIPTFLALAAIVGLGLWSDSRGIAGIAVLTGFFVLLVHGRRHVNPKVFFLIGSAALLLGVGSLLFIEGAQAGFLGERSAEQVRRFGADPISLIVNVRPELYQELDLFSQRPLTGFGSRPQLSTSEYMESIQFLHTVGVTETENLSNGWLRLVVPGVSAHSMAADSWVRAGVAAVPFWILVVVLAMSAGTAALRSRSSPLLVMWTMLVLWDTLFSPLTVPGAISLAAYLAICCGNEQRLPVDST